MRSSRGGPPTLRQLAEPTAGISIRVYLRRLRWLVDNDVLSEDEFNNRRKLVLAGRYRGGAAAVPPANTPRITFRQHRPGVTIDVELLADRLSWRRAVLVRRNRQPQHRLSRSEGAIGVLRHRSSI